MEELLFLGRRAVGFEHRADRRTGLLLGGGPGKFGGAFRQVVHHGIVAVGGLAGAFQGFFDEGRAAAHRLPAALDKALLDQILLGQRDEGVGMDGEGEDVEKGFALRLGHGRHS